MNLDLLAIAAHPDDVELTCGGTLLKMAQAGYKTGILDLTAGEMGTLGTPESRAREAAAAAKILKVKYRRTLGVPDSDVQASRAHKLRLAAAIRELRPRTVIIPYWEARHPDHYNASTLCYEGCFLAGLKQLTSLDLGSTGVADESLEVISNFKSLTRLDVSATKATDAGVKELVGLKSLTVLDLGGTEVTSEGVKALQKALPECKVFK